jgi:hypothetical protein
LNRVRICGGGFGLPPGALEGAGERLVGCGIIGFAFDGFFVQAGGDVVVAGFEVEGRQRVPGAGEVGVHLQGLV